MALSCEASALRREWSKNHIFVTLKLSWLGSSCRYLKVPARQDLSSARISSTFPSPMIQIPDEITRLPLPRRSSPSSRHFLDLRLDVCYIRGHIRAAGLIRCSDGNPPKLCCLQTADGSPPIHTNAQATSLSLEDLGRLLSSIC